MVATNPEIDRCIGRSQQWPDEMAALRPILLRGGLTEELKWGKPCYCHEGKNIAIMQEMRVEKYVPKIREGKGFRDR